MVGGQDSRSFRIARSVPNKAVADHGGGVARGGIVDGEVESVQAVASEGAGTGQIECAGGGLAA